MFHCPNCNNRQKDGSLKLALDAKLINRQFFKNKYQTASVDELIDGVRLNVTEKKKGTLYFTVLDLKYAHSRLKLAAETARHCNFNNAGETLHEVIGS